MTPPIMRTISKKHEKGATKQVTKWVSARAQSAKSRIIIEKRTTMMSDPRSMGSSCCPNNTLLLEDLLGRLYFFIKNSLLDTTQMNSSGQEERYLIKVSEHLPSVQECYEFAGMDPSCGAVATFVGITRNNFNGKVVKKLSYEGYVPMAEKELRKLCDETVQKFSTVKRIAAVHILGDCPVGNPSVILAVSSPHRRESIESIEFLIDELKARVPIWKLEVYEGDEQSVWKENLEWREGKQSRVMVKQQNKWGSE